MTDPERCLVKTSSLIRDLRFQARVKNDPEAIKHYADWYVENANKPHPEDQMAVISVVVIDGLYFIVDGFHRHCAAEAAGKDQLLCDVRIGTVEDAIMLAAAANSTNGLQRTNQDRVRSVMMLLDLPGASLWSKRELSRRAGVSTWTVDKALDIVASRASAGKSLQEERLGVRAVDDEEADEVESPEVHPTVPMHQEKPPVPVREVPEAPKNPWVQVSRFIETNMQEIATLRGAFRKPPSSGAFKRIAYYSGDIARHLDNAMKLLKACVPISKCEACHGVGVLEAGLDCGRCLGSGYATQADRSSPTERHQRLDAETMEDPF